MTAALFRAAGAVLPRRAALRRTPPRPPELRQAGYAAAFDDRTLFFDAFLMEDRVMLSGPPLLNLGTALRDAHFLFDGVPMTEGVFQDGDRTQRSWLSLPPGSTPGVAVAPSVLRVVSSALDVSVVVGSDESALFAGRRVLTTLSKDNDLRWIIDWASYHVEEHGTDALLLYDNGSTSYSAEQLLRALQDVPGVEVAAVVQWAYPYGPDGGPVTRWDSDYCQYGSLENARWRFLRRAAGVVNCDIDELVIGSFGRSVYEAAEASASGAVLLRGEWIDAVPVGPAPRRFPSFSQYGYTNPAIPRCGDKWVLVPERIPATTQWRVHDLLGTPLTHSEEFRFLHFRAVSTGWKRDSSPVEHQPGVHVLDRSWMATTEKAPALVAVPASPVTQPVLEGVLQ